MAYCNAVGHFFVPLAVILFKCSSCHTRNAPQRSSFSDQLKIFHRQFPPDGSAWAENVADRQVRELGIEWAMQQCKELIQYEVPVLHFCTMGRFDNVGKIAIQIF